MTATRVIVSVVILMLSIAGVASAEYYDFGGETIHILAQSHHPAWRFIEGDWVGTNMYGTAYGLHQEAEELFNCKIEFHVMGWSEQPQVLMSRLLSGDSENDIWVMINRRYMELMPQGAFLPLNDYLSEDYFNDLPGIPRGIADYMTFAGQRYAFGAIGGGMYSLDMILYDRDLFESLGLPDLQELYFDGEWTWDVMFDIARQATTGGEGDIERMGISGLARTGRLMTFVHTNAGASLYKEVDGRMIFTGTEPEFVDGVAAVIELINEGVAWNRQDRPGPWTFVEGIATGEFAMAITPLGGLEYFTGPAVDTNYAIVPLPIGPADDQQRYPAPHIDTALVLPANSRHPEGMIQLAHFLYPVEDYYDVVDEVIRSLAPDRVTASILYEMHDNWGPWVWNNIPPVFPATDAVAAAVRGEVTIAQAMAEVAASVQANLDDLFQ